MEIPKGVEELLALALVEATSAKAEAVEPAHLFVAACKQESSPLVRALEAQKIDAKALRRRVRSIAYGSEAQSGDEPKRISSRIWRILDNAIGRTEALRQEPTATHLIIALLRHPDATLRQIFDLENLPLQELIDHLEQGVTLGQEASLAKCFLWSVAIIRPLLSLTGLAGTTRASPIRASSIRLSVATMKPSK